MLTNLETIQNNFSEMDFITQRDISGSATNEVVLPSIRHHAWSLSNFKIKGWGSQLINFDSFKSSYHLLQNKDKT